MRSPSFHFKLKAVIFFCAGVCEEEALEVTADGRVGVDCVEGPGCVLSCAFDERVEDEMETCVWATDPPFLRLDDSFLEASVERPWSCCLDLVDDDPDIVDNDGNSYSWG